LLVSACGDAASGPDGDYPDNSKEPVPAVLEDRFAYAPSQLDILWVVETAYEADEMRWALRNHRDQFIDDLKASNVDFRLAFVDGDSAAPDFGTLVGSGVVGPDSPGISALMSGAIPFPATNTENDIVGAVSAVTRQYGDGPARDYLRDGVDFALIVMQVGSQDGNATQGPAFEDMIRRHAPGIGDILYATISPETRSTCPAGGPDGASYSPLVANHVAHFDGHWFEPCNVDGYPERLADLIAYLTPLEALRLSTLAAEQSIELVFEGSGLNGPAAEVRYELDPSAEFVFRFDRDQNTVQPLSPPPSDDGSWRVSYQSAASLR